MTIDDVVMVACIAVWTFNLAILSLIVLSLSLDAYRRRKRGW